VTSGIRSRLAGVVRTLPPGSFAVVMATGIISVGLRLEGVEIASDVLYAVAAATYAVLVVLSVLRLILFRADMVTDATRPATGFTYFTFVAGTAVVGTRISMDGALDVAGGLLLLAFAGWVVLGYVIPWAVVDAKAGRSVLTEVDGSWFVWSVASQSVAVLASSLEPHVDVVLAQALAVLAVLSWGIGLMLYGVIGTAVVIRVLTHGIRPEQLGPEFWVTMGAGAIAVLAGSRVVEMTHLPMVDAVRASVAAGAVVLWAFATWLVPALVAVGWWRHVRHRIPLDYRPALWSMVFPLGMYAVAGIYLGEADRLPLVGWIGRVFLWLAVVVWVVVSVALVVTVVRRVRPARREP
jgi:tellurite resistance protein TehA-like permease